MEYYITTEDLNFELSSVDLNLYDITENFNLSLNSVDLELHNFTPYISYLLEEYYEGTLEYKVVLDFIMDYGGIY